MNQLISLAIIMVLAFVLPFVVKRGGRDHQRQSHEERREGLRKLREEAKQLRRELRCN